MGVFMVKRWALIKDQKVINVCLWDGNTNTWSPPEGVDCIEAPDNIAIGWGWDGSNWLEPVPPPPEVPNEVSKLQFKAQLITEDYYNQVDAAVLASNDGLIKLYWQESLTFSRNSQLVDFVKTTINLTDEQMDQMFIAASTITF